MPRHAAPVRAHSDHARDFQGDACTRELLWTGILVQKQMPPSAYGQIGGDGPFLMGRQNQVGACSVEQKQAPIQADHVSTLIGIQSPMSNANQSTHLVSGRYKLSLTFRHKAPRRINTQKAISTSA
jgi:hypothetical protein